MKENKKNRITKKFMASVEKCTGGKIGDYSFDGNVLNNAFLTKDGQLIGTLEDSKFYMDNCLMVDEKYPHGVAALISDETYGTKKPNIIGMYGYNHRGGNLFSIGDRLFDDNYTPKEEDYPSEQWEKYQKEFKTAYDDADKSIKKWMDKSGISYVIPFNERGKVIINNMEQAFEAAKNLSKYLN